MERLTVKDLVPALVNIGAISIQHEKKTLASKRESYVYFNIGDLVISFPREKDLVVEALAQVYRESLIKTDRIIGVPEGANCLVSSLSDKLKIGQLRVRETRAQHGDQKTIEGSFISGQTVGIFEDVVSSGMSIKMRAYDPLKSLLLQPNAVFVLIDREYGGRSMIQNKLHLPYFAFTTTSEIAKELISTSAFNDAELRLLKDELASLTN